MELKNSYSSITDEQFKELKEEAEKYLQYWKEQNVSYTLPSLSTMVEMFRYQKYGVDNK